MVAMMAVLALQPHEGPSETCMDCPDAILRCPLQPHEGSSETECYKIRSEPMEASTPRGFV